MYKEKKNRTEQTLDRLMCAQKIRFTCSCYTTVWWWI